MALSTEPQVLKPLYTGVQVAWAIPETGQTLVWSHLLIYSFIHSTYVCWVQLLPWWLPEKRRTTLMTDDTQDLIDVPSPGDSNQGLYGSP